MVTMEDKGSQNAAETPNAGRQIELYESPDHRVHLEVRVDGETVWLTQQQLAALFGRDVTTIRRHISNARREELQGISVSAKFALTAADHKTYQVEHYNLDLILSVGYRVKSTEGVFFRRWANTVLKQHLTQGYTLNRKRLEALGSIVRILERSSEAEIAGTASILKTYLPSLQLLNAYDENDVPAVKGTRATWRLTYEDAIAFVRAMPYYGQTGLFGRERNGSFRGIIEGLYQTFGGEELYASVQAKAANLLYQVVKDHPFSDGNKRCAAALFVYFLDRNGMLLDPSGARVIDGNALASMTLMIALSAPSEKDMMIALVGNFLTPKG